MITLYGIANCDTMKKARQWLNNAGVEYQFHDYKKQGLDATTLDTWMRELGHEALINKRGTTWRKLADEEKASLTEEHAKALILNNLSLIKRPLLDTGTIKHLGFSDADYQSLFK